MKELSKKEWVAVSVAVLFVGYTLFGGSVTSLFNIKSMQDNTQANNQNTNTDTEQASVAQALSSGAIMNDVLISDSIKGQGAEATTGKAISVNYVLALSDGTVLQNSKDFGAPFTFVLGAGQVIQGWEKGFMGMKVGGVRTIVVPPSLGYGTQQVGPIPANSTLVFTVELLDVADAPAR